MTVVETQSLSTSAARRGAKAQLWVKVQQLLEDDDGIVNLHLRSASPSKTPLKLPIIAGRGVRRILLGGDPIHPEGDIVPRHLDPNLGDDPGPQELAEYPEIIGHFVP